MSMQIFSFEKNQFPLDDITLANPQGLQGGAFFSKLKLLGNNITIQTPRCKTKNGIVKTEKKIYCDLMFEKDDENVIEFLEGLEDKIKNLIYEKKDKWFHSDMDMDTIDYHWQNILRSYKGSKILLRCFIKKPKSRLNSQPTLQIYDEDESLLKIDDLTKEKTLMALLEVTGLKFTSQSFSLEFNLTQAMVLKDKVFRNKCLIKSVNNSDDKVEDNALNTNNTVLKISELQPNDDDDNNNIMEQESSQVVEEDLEASEDTVIKSTYESTDVNTTNIDDAENTQMTKVHGISSSTELSQKNDIELKNKMIVPQLKLENLENNKLVEESHENTNNSLESLAKSDQLPQETEVKEENNLLVNTEPLEKNTELNEINLVMPEDKETVQLKKPNEVYMEIYREVKKRAKEAKKRAIEAYLEAKRIKSIYLLDEIESSDDENELLEMTGIH
jgi:hypothetical protein